MLPARKKRCRGSDFKIVFWKSCGVTVTLINGFRGRTCQTLFLCIEPKSHSQKKKKKNLWAARAAHHNHLVVFIIFSCFLCADDHHTTTAPTSLWVEGREWCLMCQIYFQTCGSLRALVWTMLNAAKWMTILASWRTRACIRSDQSGGQRGRFTAEGGIRQACKQLLGAQAYFTHQPTQMGYYCRFGTQEMPWGIQTYIPSYLQCSGCPAFSYLRAMVGSIHNCWPTAEIKM